jgi:hypothetical protein
MNIEAIAYERYVTFCKLLGQRAMPIDSWRTATARIPEWWGAVKDDNMAGRLGTSRATARRTF